MFSRRFFCYKTSYIYTEEPMKPVKIGNVSISSIIERDGPWREPHIMFPSATPDTLNVRRHR